MKFSCSQLFLAFYPILTFSGFCGLLSEACLVPVSKPMGTYWSLWLLIPGSIHHIDLKMFSPLGFCGMAVLASLQPLRLYLL